MQNNINLEGQIQWLEAIQLTQLSNRALMLASQLGRSIRRLNGEVIVLQNQGMAARLSEQVAIIGDDDLNALFRDFLEEVLRIDDRGYPTPLVNIKKRGRK